MRRRAARRLAARSGRGHRRTAAQRQHRLPGAGRRDAPAVHDRARGDAAATDHARPVGHAEDRRRAARLVARRAPDRLRRALGRGHEPVHRAPRRNRSPQAPRGRERLPRRACLLPRRREARIRPQRRADRPRDLRRVRRRQRREPADHGHRHGRGLRHRGDLVARRQAPLLHARARRAARAPSSSSAPTAAGSGGSRRGASMRPRRRGRRTARRSCSRASRRPHPGRSANLFTIAPAGGAMTQLTHFRGGSTHGFGPAWSPDGSRIVWHKIAPGLDQLFVMDASGRGQRQLTRMPGSPKAEPRRLGNRPLRRPCGAHASRHSRRFPEVRQRVRGSPRRGASGRTFRESIDHGGGDDRVGPAQPPRERGRATCRRGAVSACRRGRARQWPRPAAGDAPARGDDRRGRAEGGRGGRRAAAARLPRLALGLALRGDRVRVRRRLRPACRRRPARAARLGHPRARHRELRLRRSLLGHRAAAHGCDPLSVARRRPLSRALPGRLRRARAAAACARRTLPGERLARRRDRRGRPRGDRRRARVPVRHRHDGRRDDDRGHEHRLPDRRPRAARARGVRDRRDGLAARLVVVAARGRLRALCARRHALPLRDRPRRLCRERLARSGLARRADARRRREHPARDARSGPRPSSAGRRSSCPPLFGAVALGLVMYDHFTRINTLALLLAGRHAGARDRASRASPSRSTSA